MFGKRRRRHYWFFVHYFVYYPINLLVNARLLKPVFSCDLFLFIVYFDGCFEKFVQFSRTAMFRLAWIHKLSQQMRMVLFLTEILNIFYRLKPPFFAINLQLLRSILILMIIFLRRFLLVLLQPGLIIALFHFLAFLIALFILIDINLKLAVHSS
jgi:hypothetical protein